MYKRRIKETVEKALFKGKVIIIYGPRQAGKTTLVKSILEKSKHTSRYVNADERDVRIAMEDKTSTELKAFLGNDDIVVIDEAQRVRNIGLTLKLLIDTFPKMQIIVTGSSSFDLANQVNEPLTGRKEEFFLPPLSFGEFVDAVGTHDANRLLEHRMVYGMYPEIVLSSQTESEKLLRELTKSYVFKDILSFGHIRHPEVVEKLLTALALQTGSEVSYTELSRLIGISKETIERYIRILEQAFIIFTLAPWSRNVRTELRKLRKIYFWDTGLRNVLINNLNPLELRQDVGALWENFLIVERRKKNMQEGRYARAFFWRTHQQQEIDYLEDYNGRLDAFEFKWGNGTWNPPAVFTTAYPNAHTIIINRNNVQTFIV